MTRTEYYERMKSLARQVRSEFGIDTPRVRRSDLRRVYAAHGIRIDYWDHRLKSVRGAYFYDHEIGPSVMLDRRLPEDPLIFTMGHELKHHLVDRESLVSYCGSSNDQAPVEIGAEVFAAELIYPEHDFMDALTGIGVGLGGCEAEDLVRLKHETMTTLSYAGLPKRAERLSLAPTGSLAKVKWRTLETELYGEPVYKRIVRARRARLG